MSKANLDGIARELECQRTWLQRLAREVAGPTDADDLVQETFVAALEHRPAPDRSLRPWLRRVARNAQAMALRSGLRRANRESSAELASEPVPGADAILQQSQRVRWLMQAIEEIPRLYRQTLWERYFEDRTTAEIAEQHGVSASTIRWRIKVALDMLRADLDRRSGGDRQSWVVSLIPLTGSQAKPPTALASGALLMSNATKITIAGLAAAIAATALLATGPTPTDAKSTQSSTDRAMTEAEARESSDAVVARNEPTRRDRFDRRRVMAVLKASSRLVEHDDSHEDALIGQPEQRSESESSVDSVASQWIDGTFGRTAREAGFPDEVIHNMGERLRTFGAHPDDTFEEAMLLAVENQDEVLPPDALREFTAEEKENWLEMPRETALRELATVVRNDYVRSNNAGADYRHPERDYVDIAANLLWSWDCEAAGLPLMTCDIEQPLQPVMDE